MTVPKSARQNLYKYLGDKTDKFLSDTNNRLKKYTQLWQLTGLSFMQTDTVNLLLSCESNLYGPCVLKMCIPGPVAVTEINCLLAYDGKGFCKLWAYDTTDNVLLLQQVIPGHQMWAVSDYRERARLMADVVKNLPHIPLDGQTEYLTYLGGMEEIHRILTGKGGMEELLFYLDKAMEIYIGLKQHYRKSYLLHGDLHQENMLLNYAGGYTIIDPQGVVDDPVMLTARFLMNELPCEESKIYEIVAIMSPIIQIPEKDMLKCMFIDCALMNCWCMDRHFSTLEAVENKKQDSLETCKFVYGLVSK